MLGDKEYGKSIREIRDIVNNIQKAEKEAEKLNLKKQLMDSVMDLVRAVN